MLVPGETFQVRRGDPLSAVQTAECAVKLLCKSDEIGYESKG